MATFVIGDVHGNVAALEDLLQQLTGELADDDALVFLGDYIDRGPATKECIDRIISLRDEFAGQLVCLRGNHEDWLLKSYRDHRRHTWLLATDAFETIQSYSTDAADTLRDAIAEAGAALFGGDCALPYEVFFDCVPKAHLEFFLGLQFSYRNADCVCSHGGLDPSVRTLEAQSQYALIWGASGFPDDYAGPEVVVYGHRNNALLNHEKWPLPAMTDVTIGVDTISHGVLTAVRMPDRRIFQSARHRAGRSGP